MVEIDIAGGRVVEKDATRGMRGGGLARRLSELNEFTELLLNYWVGLE